jgi:hypothetical protein
MIHKVLILLTPVRGLQIIYFCLLKMFIYKYKMIFSDKL